MSYSLLILLARWTVFLFVGGLAASIAIKLLTGRINTHGLLYGTRSDGSKFFSPGRAQLLVVTIAIAFQYVLNASRAGSGEFPRLPAGSLELLGASNAFYLGGKAWYSFKSLFFRDVPRGEDELWKR